MAIPRIGTAPFSGASSIFPALDSRYLKLDASNDPITGPLLVKNTSNSTSVFTVQNASSVQLFNIDATNSQTTVGENTTSSALFVVSSDLVVNKPLMMTRGVVTSNSGANFVKNLTGRLDANNDAAHQLIRMVPTFQPLTTITTAINGVNMSSNIGNATSNTNNMTTYRGLFINIVKGSGFSGTVTNLRKLEINSSSGFTVTNEYGLILTDMTGGSTINVSLLLGSTSAAAGNWSIYNISALANYFQGDTWVGLPTSTGAKFRAHQGNVTASADRNTAQFTTGTVTFDTTTTTYAHVRINRPALSINTGITITNGTALYVVNSPSAAGVGTLTNAYAIWVDDGTTRLDGLTGIGGVTTPTALLMLAAGTASASTAPLKFTSGTILTTAEPGVHEYNGNHYLSTASLRFPVGGTLFDHFVDANNGTTVETDLYSDTLAASTFTNNGGKVIGHYQLVCTGAALSTQQMRIYFGGTLIYDSGTLSLGAVTDNFTFNFVLIRVSSSVVRCSVSVSTDFGTLFPYSKYTEVTGLTLTNTQIVKITGQSAGAGALSNQITAKEGFVAFAPAA